ncbi:TPA: hypothetical protein ACGI1Q_002884 [Staphylococcus argenteus]|nr:hypothetical protein [Staphylococcus argenteus]MBE2120120.1 hypothetical protein [Staphylococcus argenteus]HDY9477238.1 hypothetical protein [Staphylococcus argenteus]HDY9487806.1 hypothetical protein [Staphylococcus argenteus]HDY9489522.1 hypothetical protein [Staphylococcus argenteus]HDY9583937.1 hypothetical protein [Staphylococcus argenteus]
MADVSVSPTCAFINLLSSTALQNYHNCYFKNFSICLIIVIIIKKFIARDYQNLIIRDRSMN